MKVKVWTILCGVLSKPDEIMLATGCKDDDEGLYIYGNREELVSYLDNDPDIVPIHEDRLACSKDVWEFWIECVEVEL